MALTLAQCEVRRVNLLNKQQMAVNQHIKITDTETIIYGREKNKVYRPTPTGIVAHSDNSFVRLITGPFGSGKSTWCAHEIIRRTCRMPKWHAGRRRARWAVVRNTSGELYSTTLQTWLAWFGELGDISKRQKPLLTYEHTFNDGNGVVELELIFIALDRPDDVRKIKSLELTGVYLNEMSELPQAALSHMKGRINGRYPSKQFCPDSYWSGIIADTNPPDEDHYIYQDFEVANLESYKVFHQPPGLIIQADGSYTQNPMCDNYSNLSSDYYTKLAEGQTQGFINVFCMGKYGLVESGKRVYPEYNDDFHAVDDIPAIQGTPIHLGWDFGLTPACIVVQFTPRGHLHILKEYLAQDMGIRTFAKSIVIPGLEADFPYCKVGESEGDPSGANGDTIMEELSCIGELNSLGIKTNAASTNEPDVRIASVRYFLNTMVDGKPALRISKNGASVTRKGFINGYHFKRMNIANEDRHQDKPNKNKYSHPHDGLQYIAMKFASDRILETKVPREKIDMFNPVLRIF